MPTPKMRLPAWFVIPKHVHEFDYKGENQIVYDAKNADVAIHECMMTPEDAVNKYRFPVARALEVFTQIHTSPEAFGKVMSEVRPRMAIAYHFFTDFDVKPGVGQGISRTYDGPLSLADDLMVWNVTKDAIRVRQVVPIEEAWPPPAAVQAPPVDTTGMKNVSPEIQSETFDVSKENQMIYDRVNKKYGTNVKMRVTK